MFIPLKNSLKGDDFQKIIFTNILISQYTGVYWQESESVLFEYYLKLDTSSSCENFLFKEEIQKYFNDFQIKTPWLSNKPLSLFEKLNGLAKISHFEIQQNKNSVLSFLKSFIEKHYEVPIYLINRIFSLIEEIWKPIFTPIGLVEEKKYEIAELEEYFFKGISKPSFSINVVPDIDRYFSFTSSDNNILFLPKKNEFSLFESAQVIHEFKHVIEMYLGKKKSLYQSEKSALKAEFLFLSSHNFTKKVRFSWLESNLFYPLLLLKWELDIILSDVYDISSFNKICSIHGMEPFLLSKLFDFKNPFQMIVYCAASMEIEENWEKYLYP